MDGRQFWPAELTARTEPIGKSIYYFTVQIGRTCAELAIWQPYNFPPPRKLKPYNLPLATHGLRIVGGLEGLWPSASVRQGQFKNNRPK